MDRVAVFVDAGYLYTGGATSISGSPKKRTELNLDVPAAIKYLITRAEALSQQKLLRVYWYDGALSNRLNTDQQLLASTDNVKLRLGVVNGVGEQKGVDARIITDLTELARNGAFCDAVLVGGDEDLRIGVELAQQRGARVHLLTIEKSTSSPTLRQEADTVSTIATTDIQTFLTVVTAAPPTSALSPAAKADTISHPVSPATVNAPTMPLATTTSAEPPADGHTDDEKAELFDKEVTAYLGGLSGAEQVALSSAVKTGGGVPTEHDGRILARTREALGRTLSIQEKTKLRKTLKSKLGARSSTETPAS